MDTLHDRERAQSLVLVALMLFVLIGMLALIIDGGMAYAQRRNAQNAADAAALAGAQELCAGRPFGSVVQDYALTKNQATRVLSYTNSAGLTVIADINYETFFANIFGRDEMTVTAQATAGCFAPCLYADVLPVGWSCREATTNASGIPIPPPPITSTMNCDIHYDPGGTLGYRYAIMDSFNLNKDLLCADPTYPVTDTVHQPTGAIDCDLDPKDGTVDFMAGGNRSWLNLNGGPAGESELANWMRYGYRDGLGEHYWVPGETGNMNSAYRVVDNYLLGKEVVIPVYDQYCAGFPSSTSPACAAYWHAEDHVNDVNATSATYFHVTNFSVFKITCIEYGSTVAVAPGYSPSSEVVNGHCKAKNAFLLANSTTLGITNHGDEQKLNSIEGYFLRKYIPENQGACGPTDNFGTYTIYLK